MYRQMLIEIEWLADGSVVNIWVWFHTSQNNYVFHMGIIHDAITWNYGNHMTKIPCLFFTNYVYLYKIMSSKNTETHTATELG